MLAGVAVFLKTGDGSFFFRAIGYSTRRLLMSAGGLPRQLTGPMRRIGWAQRADGSRVGEKVYQVWFPGSHPDVGGGYKEHGMSNIALAGCCGERKKADWTAAHSIRVLGRMIHHLFWSVDPYVRPIGPVQRQERGEPWSVVNESICESVFERIEGLGTEAYGPLNLVQNGKIRTDPGSVERFIERKSPRREVHGEAQIRAVCCTVLDLSDSGARLLVDARVRVGAPSVLKTQQDNALPRWCGSRGVEADVRFEEVPVSGTESVSGHLPRVRRACIPAQVPGRSRPVITRSTASSGVRPRAINVSSCR